jgi:hypothetical protein
MNKVFIQDVPMDFFTVKHSRVFNDGVPVNFFYILKHQLLFHFVPEKVRCIFCRAVGAAGTAI